jgi:biopolymer transport protein TolR
MNFASSAGRIGGRTRRAPLAEINVTPLVDVMLVLLVIFMITAPMLMTGVQVHLPKAQTAPLPQDKHPVEVALDAQGILHLEGNVVQASDLPQVLQALQVQHKDNLVYLRADAALPYGKVMEAAGAISGAGLKLALVTTGHSAAQAGHEKK